MGTEVTEIAPDVYRLSTYVSDAGIVFNQFLVAADEPLLFHSGPRALFPLVSAAVERVVPVSSLRWVTFGHVEADECGAMNLWLAAAPRAEVAHGALGCAVSVADLADRPPRLSRTARCSTWAGAGSGASRRRTSRTVGTPSWCTRRRRTRSCAATCSPPWAPARRSPSRRSPVRRCRPRTCSGRPA